METQQQSFIVKALQNFKGKTKEELSFKKGDLITVSITNEEAMQYFGECGGKSGWFPYFYVKSIGVGVAGDAKGSSTPDVKHKPRPNDKHRMSTPVVGSRVPQTMNKKDQRKSMRELKKQQEKGGVVVVGGLPMNMDSAYVLKTGPLVKRSGGIGKVVWKKRWFVLRSDALTFYKSAVDTKPLGKVPVRHVISVAVEFAEDAKMQFCFSVNTKRSAIFVSASSMEERDEWMDAINGARKGGRPADMMASPSVPDATKDATGKDKERKKSKGSSERKQKDRPRKHKDKDGGLDKEGRKVKEGKIRKKDSSTVLQEVVKKPPAPPPASAKKKPSARRSDEGMVAEVTNHLKSLAAEDEDEVAALQSQLEKGGGAHGEDDLALAAANLSIDIGGSIQQQSASVQVQKKRGVRVRAKYDYVGRTDAEFTFRINDEWMLLEKLPTGWWRGEMRGVIGHFPASYVDVIGDESILNQPEVQPAATASSSQHAARCSSGGSQKAATTAAPSGSGGGRGSQIGKDSRKKKKMVGKYQLGGALGKGAYGQVYRGIDVESGRMVAVKEVALDMIPKGELNSTMAELELLEKLHHVNIVQYNGFIREDDAIYIVLEFVEGGSLEAILRKFGSVPESLIIRYVRQVLQGLDYLHGQGVIHRDIKCGNILITKEGIVKLADFGIASKLGESSTSGQAPGSPFWMAPEVIQMEEHVQPAADIWSLGCTIIELLTGSPPNFHMNAMQAMFSIVENPPPETPEDCSPELASFLEACLRKNPLERPSARELMSHRMIRGEDEAEPEVEEEEEEKESEIVEEETLEVDDGSDPEYKRWEREVGEIFTWMKKAIEKDNVRHVVKFRKALRRKKKELRAAHKDDDAYKDLLAEIRRVMYDVEGQYGEHIPLDSDSDSDSEEEFLDDDEFEDEEDFDDMMVF